MGMEFQAPYKVAQIIASKKSCWFSFGCDTDFCQAKAEPILALDYFSLRVH